MLQYSGCHEEKRRVYCALHADVAEPVDATDLKSVEGNLVGVQVPPSAPMSMAVVIQSGAALFAHDQNRRAFETGLAQIIKRLIRLFQRIGMR